MSSYARSQEYHSFDDVGKRLAHRLHEARHRQGMLRCPVCGLIFDGTHLMKCPQCRTLISKTFRRVPAGNCLQMELDFF